MRYAITGAAGHISKPLVQTLLDRGHDVTVIGRNKQHLEELVKSGAHSAIGSVEDVEFVKKAFAGVHAARLGAKHCTGATFISLIAPQKSSRRKMRTD